MRLIKMFSLAAIAAVAAMAFLGASSASADDTLLCKNDTLSLTPSAAECGVVHKIHFLTVGHAVLLGAINVECNALLSAETHDLLVINGPVVFDLKVELIYYNCLGGCAAKVVGTPGVVEVLKTGVELADITANGFVVNVTCFGVNCDYDAKNLVGHGIRSGGESHVVYEKDTVNVLAKLGGFITCPSTGALDALFRSLLEDIYIRA